MSPPGEHFSFRWLLRKSKSAKFAKEVSQAPPSSRSCEVAEKQPSFLLWKLLPSGRAKLPFRSSFSCGDVAQASCQLLAPAASARDVRFLAQCRLCLGAVPLERMVPLQQCGCTFCITCLRQYLVINIKDGNIPITCPDANCPHTGKILLSEIKEIAGEDASAMFERYQLNLDVELDPRRVWCPSPGCETICTVTREEPVQCLTCRLKFCSECKMRWHAETSCEQARKADEIDSSSRLEEEIKRCPNCRIPIEKDEGCAQMMCYRCKHVFCWHCLASLDDDFLLRHYDKGPCRNMLGHSRASMIWHRTQVVGIFAGFSFLLLVASPFLLLAAPCLLCCRCRHRPLYEEATPL